MNTLSPDLPLDPPASAPPPAPARRPLQRRLMLLALAVLLPVLVAATASLLYEMHVREQEVQRTALHTARAIGVAVRAEIDGTIGTLEALATSEALRTGRLSRFEQRARQLVETRGWRNLTVTDAQGRLLLSSNSPDLAEPVDPASVQRAIEERLPVVGNLLSGRNRRAPGFAVRLPIVSEGQVQYVVSAVLGSERVLDLIREQNLPDSHVVAVFDPAGLRIARTVEHSEQRASPSLQVLWPRGATKASASRARWKARRCTPVSIA